MPSFQFLSLESCFIEWIMATHYTVLWKSKVEVAYSIWINQVPAWILRDKITRSAILSEFW